MTREQLAVDLFLTFETPDATHFNAHLFRLFHKADAMNQLKLAVGFPTEYSLYKEWYNSPTAEAFYQKYEVRKRLKHDD